MGTVTIRRARRATVALLVLAMLTPAASGAAARSGSLDLPGATVAAPSPEEPLVRVIVRFKADSSPAARSEARAAVRGARVRRLGNVPGLELLTVRMPAADAISRLRTQRSVVYAVPDAVISAADLPDDPRLGELWGLAQPSDIDIDAPEAWTVETGAGAVVAVVDSGIELGHPDLETNLWINPGEVPGNGLDDDHNGFVDDVHGWDFVDDDNLPEDLHGHGTHVAGTIGAVVGNGIGVAGVAPGVALLPLRILDEDGQGFVSDAVRALDYAWRAGVRVSNHSWTSAGGAFQPLADAIAAAGDRGHMVVAAAGNDGGETDVSPVYPAAIDLPNVLSVAAIDRDGALAPFSNRGPASVDVGAPGVDILSTWLGAGYTSQSGTSMAAAHVAGTVALLLAAHPGWTVGQVRARVLGTVTPLPALEGLTASGGLVNAVAALDPSADLAPVVTITAPAPGAASLPGSVVSFAASAIDAEDGDVAPSLAWVSDVDGPIGSGASFARSDLSAGWHRVSATATDGAGHVTVATVRTLVGPQIETIADDGGIGPIALAVTEGGAPYIAYTRPKHGTTVAQRVAGTWEAETVTSAYQESWPALAIDTAGAVRLAVAREWSSSAVFADPGIVAATRGPAGWSTTRVTDPCGDDHVGCTQDTMPAVAADLGGRAHAAWVGTPTGNSASDGLGLWYGRENAGGGWTPTYLLPMLTGSYGPDIATGPAGSAHVVFARPDGDPGIWYATNAAGTWAFTKLSAALGPSRIAVAADGDVDVAYATTSGTFVVSRTAGAWGAPALVTAARSTDVDLVRVGDMLHLAIGVTGQDGTSTGIRYATGSGTSWTVTPLDDGQDIYPRIAADGAGAVHVAYVRAWPQMEVRHVTGIPGAFVTDVVVTGFSWGKAAVGVDAAGVRHVAVSRFGDLQGVWYATDTGGAWSMERVSTIQVDGDVGLAVRDDGTVAIAWGEAFTDGGVPLPDRATRVAVGTKGTWSISRVADDTVTSTHAIAWDGAGALHLAFGDAAGNSGRVAYATNAGGSWRVTQLGPIIADAHSRDPSIAVDAQGRVHLAFERTTPNVHPYGSVDVLYATNASGAWVITPVTAVPAYNWLVTLRLDNAGQPRIAYQRTYVGATTTMRLARFDGATWSDDVVSDAPYVGAPGYAIDASGNDHFVYSTGGLDYAVCGVPLCPDYPGLQWTTSSPGSTETRRLTNYGDDELVNVVRGLDGSLAATFVNAGWRLAAVRLERGQPLLPAPVTHLAPAGTVLPQRRALVTIHAASGGPPILLEQREGSGPFVRLAGPAIAIDISLTVTPSASVERQLRVVAADGSTARPAYGPAVRVSATSEAASGALTYTGTWRKASRTAYYGGRVRTSSSSTARARYRFTGSEIAWVSTRAANRGRARVYIDGRYVTTVRLRGATSYRRIVFRRVLADGGPHVLTIRPVGDGRVDVDAFVVLR